MSTASSASKIWRGFNAVDLVTLAVFAALYRALWYVWHALGFLFPFNQVLSDFFYVLCGLAAFVIVRKIGAISLFAVAAQLINLFLQGEMLLVCLILITPGLLADLYLYIQAKGGANIMDSKSILITAGIIAGVWWSLINFAGVFPFIFLTVLSVPMYIAAGVTCAVGGWLGALSGFSLGNRVKGLIG
jgi:hypothetical protein